jgi:outer membrane protein OmpA-like peptidoglycan-associated protein
MRKIIIVLSLTGFLFSQDFGTTSLPLLRVSFSARASSLGEAFTASLDDGATLWWNPGSMGLMKHCEGFITNHIWFQDFRDYYLGSVFATRKGVFGTGLVYSGVKGIELWDEQNYPQKGNDKASSFILQFAYGRKIHRQISAGGGIKFLSDRIVNKTGTGFAFDVGGYYSYKKEIGFAGCIRNFGPAMKYGKTSSSLPTEIRFGGRFGPYYYNTIFTDLSYVNKTGFTFSIGDEIWFKDVVALRFGYKSAYQLNDLTFGIGIKYTGLHIDYAFAGYGILGGTHRIWLSKEWGELLPVGGLIVKVIDEETKKPLDATIEFGKPIGKKLTTDTITGSVKFKNLPIGQIGFKVEKEKYYPKADSTTIEPDVVKLKIVKLKRIPPGGIMGKVIDVATKKPLPAKIIYKGIFEGETYSDTITGIYKILKLEAGEYTLSVEPGISGYIPQEAKVEVKPGETVNKDFELIRKGEVIILKGVNFETGKATLTPESYAILDEVGKILVDNPHIKVEIAGHTDNVPIKTKEFPDNMALSQARAEAVRNYLIEKFKIEPERLVAKGYGETQPIASNKTPEGRAKNRRVEFRVIE